MAKGLMKYSFREIFVYVLLSFLLPFVCLLLIKHTPLGQSSIAYFLIFGVEAASPSIAAVITLLLFYQKSDVKAFFSSNFSPKLKIYSVIICVVLAFAILFTAKYISCLLLKSPFELAELTVTQLLIIGWAFIAEELGWRGFLTKALAASFPQVFVPFLVGLIWGLWHYHFFILGTIDVAIPLFFAGCIADSYLYAALLTISKGNLLAAMIYHTASNLYINLFLVNPNVNHWNALPYALYVIISALFAVVIPLVLNYVRKRNQLI